MFIPKLLYMSNDDLMSVLPRERVPEPAGDPLAGLRRYNAHSIAPLAVEINLPGLRANGQSDLNHHHVIRELRLWSTQLKRRPVTRIHLSDPFGNLDAPALTELVYALAQCLRVSTAEKFEHAVSVRLRDITKSNIALLKGLKFNHIAIRVAEKGHPDHLKAVIGKLEDFRIAFVSLIIKWPTDRLEQEQALTTCLRLKPETLTLCGTSSPGSVEYPDDLLLSRGYYWSAERQAIVRLHSPLIRPAADCLKPGPGGIATFGHFAVQNYKHFAPYQAALQEARLPVETVIRRL